MHSTVASHHYDGGRYNERHAGLGLDLTLDDGSGVALGAYRNSHDARSHYVAAYAHHGGLRWGVLAADGYQNINPSGVVIAPYLSYRCAAHVELAVFSFAATITLAVPLASW